MVDLSRRSILKAGIASLILDSKILKIVGNISLNTLEIIGGNDDIAMQFFKLVDHLNILVKNPSNDYVPLVNKAIEDFDEKFFQYITSLPSSRDKYIAFSYATPHVTTGSFIKIFPQLNGDDQLGLVLRFIETFSYQGWGLDLFPYIFENTTSKYYDLPVYVLSKHYFSAPKSERDAFYKVVSKVFSMTYTSETDKKKLIEYMLNSDICMSQQEISESMEMTEPNLEKFLYYTISNLREILEDIQYNNGDITIAELNSPLDIIRSIFESLDISVKEIFQELINNRFVGNISLTDQLGLPQIKPNFDIDLLQENRDFLKNINMTPSQTLLKKVSGNRDNNDQDIQMVRMRIIMLLRNRS